MNRTMKDFFQNQNIQVSIEDMRLRVGKGVKILIDKIMILLKDRYQIILNDQEYKRFTQIYTNYLGETVKENIATIYDNEIQTLQMLKDKNIPVVIITNKTQEAATNSLNYFNNLIQEAYGIEGNRKCKPDPNLANYIIESKQMSKDNVLFIGDSETDWQTAQNAGLNCFILCSGFRTKDELLQSGVKSERIVNNWKELQSKLLELM